jgi:hypothetical protein
MQPAGRGAQGNQVAARPGSASAGCPIRRPHLPHHPRTWVSRGGRLGGVAAIGNGWWQWTEDVQTMLRNTGYCVGDQNLGFRHCLYADKKLWTFRTFRTSDVYFLCISMQVV